MLGRNASKKFADKTIFSFTAKASVSTKLHPTPNRGNIIPLYMNGTIRVNITSPCTKPPVKVILTSSHHLKGRLPWNVDQKT